MTAAGATSVAVPRLPVATAAVAVAPAAMSTAAQDNVTIIELRSADFGMITLTIKHSLENEVSTVRAIISKYDWYLQMGYPAENICLPSGVTKDSAGEEMQNAVRMEYDKDAYNFFAQKLLAIWPAFQPGFTEMKSMPSFDLKNAYEIILTKYGTGGGYNPARSLVILRMAEHAEKSAAITAHEIVHMAIDRYIRKFDVPHWRKERLVDLLVERFFPGKKMRQKAPLAAVTAVDSAYESSFPDIEAITKAIGNKNEGSLRKIQNHGD